MVFIVDFLQKGHLSVFDVKRSGLMNFLKLISQKIAKNIHGCKSIVYK